jgi:hypothetical protein
MTSPCRPVIWWRLGGVTNGELCIGLAILAIMHLSTEGIDAWRRCPVVLATTVALLNVEPLGICFCQGKARGFLRLASFLPPKMLTQVVQYPASLRQVTTHTTAKFGTHLAA